MSPGAKLVTFVRVETQAPPRLTEAQSALDESVRRLGLDALPFPAGRKLVLFGDVLSGAREACAGKAFVWCNSDLILTRDPFDVPDPGKVYGFHRREIPSGRVAYGVDMYYLPVNWWDSVLCRDIPRLYLGASFVDWWISRAMQKAGVYENLTGYIDHVTHPTSSAASSDANTYYQRNFCAYNRWARRNGLEPIPAPPYLIPKLGHVWGARDALRKLWSFGRNKVMDSQT